MGAATDSSAHQVVCFVSNRPQASAGLYLDHQCRGRFPVAALLRRDKLSELNVTFGTAGARLRK